jgi:hypothetical protein
MIVVNEPWKGKIWLVSFADDDGFRGLCICDEGDNPDEVLATCKRHGVDPGGEALASRIPDEITNMDPPFAAWIAKQTRWRLIAEDELPPSLFKKERDVTEAERENLTRNLEITGSGVASR